MSLTIQTPEIIYSDSDLAVMIKPSKTLSQPSRTGGDACLTDILRDHFDSLCEPCDIFPVHRLDRETCGLMVYARNVKSAAALSEAFSKNGPIDGAGKEYLAIIIGEPDKKADICRDLLYHDAKRNKSYVTDRMRRGVREASLEYSAEASAEHGNMRLSLLRIVLHTGRTHQIRVQLSHRGMPVYGDAKYGGRADDMKSGEISLACVSLSFPNPRSGERMSFSYTPSHGLWTLFSGNMEL